jgi:hypothetical protein
MRLLKQGPKPKSPCLPRLAVPAVALVALLIWLVTP